MVPADAHATLLFTSPAVDGAVPDSPPSIQLVFDQPVVAPASSLSVTNQQGEAMSVGDAQAGSGPNVVSADVLQKLSVGEYLVHWEVVARDGDTMVGEFRFAVGSGRGLALQDGDVETEGVTVTSVLRWVMFAGLALALGGLVGGRLARRQGQSRDTLPRPWSPAGAALGVAGASGLALLVAGAGSLAQGVERFDLSALAASTPGRVALLEMGSFALALVLLLAKRGLLAGLILLLVPIGEGLRAHPHAASPTLGAMTTTVHLAAAAIWVGALIHVLRVGVSRRRQGERTADLVRSYARLALALFALVLFTGVVAGLLLVPLDELATVLVDTGYGRWLLAKLSLLVGVAALAGWAHWFLTKHPARSQPSRAARYEAGALVAVLGISGILTALSPPSRSDIPLPFPPPPVGPVEAVGGRAGFIGIGATASQGQLLVRLYTPDVSADLENETGATALAGNITASDDAEATTLEFRRCGPGCYVAPVEWAAGQSTVTLHARAEGWAGGTAAVQVAWPPRPVSGRLKAVVAAMRRVPHFTLHEQVTSDTTTGLGTLRKLRLTGDEFLDSEPYGSGIAPVVTRLRGQGGEITLALGYPGEGTYVLLTASREDRITRETLVSATHLVTRTFVYDEPQSHQGHERDHRG